MQFTCTFLKVLKAFMLIYTFRLSFVQKDSSAKSKKRVGKNQHTIVLIELNTIHSYNNIASFIVAQHALTLHM